MILPPDPLLPYPAPERAEPDLRAAADRELRSGRLPRRAPDDVWGGPGQGRACDLCRAPVGPGEMEVELEFRGEAPPRAQLTLHVRCFDVWELERRSAGVLQEIASDTRVRAREPGTHGESRRE
jgi:hypothetical protein